VTTSYYFLVASLPSLAFSTPAQLLKSDFITECRRHLSAEHMTELDALLEGRSADVKTDFSRRWFDAECQLRNAIVRSRALRLGVDEKKFIKDHRGFRLDVESAVDDAFSRANPLERELALDRFRWSLADELSAGCSFQLPALLAYGVKLSIHERWRALTAELGRERFEEVIGTVGVSSGEVAGWAGLAQL